MKQSTFLRKVLREALKQGFELVAFDNGGDRVPVRTVEDAIKAAREVDDGYLLFRTPEGKKTHAWVVWQGPDDTYKEGGEIIADYGVSLSPVIEPLWDALDA